MNGNHSTRGESGSEAFAVWETMRRLSHSAGRAPSLRLLADDPYRREIEPKPFVANADVRAF